MNQPMDLAREELAGLTREQLLARVESELEGVKRMRLARRLAPGYIHHFLIFPNGVDLIPWLTSSRCRSNAEALVEWIEAQLEDPSLTEGAGWMPESVLIAHRLGRRLAFVKASLPW